MVTFQEERDIRSTYQLALDIEERFRGLGYDVESAEPPLLHPDPYWSGEFGDSEAPEYYKISIKFENQFHPWFLEILVIGGVGLALNAVGLHESIRNFGEIDPLENWIHSIKSTGRIGGPDSIFFKPANKYPVEGIGNKRIKYLLSIEEGIGLSLAVWLDETNVNSWFCCQRLVSRRDHGLADLLSDPVFCLGATYESLPFYHVVSQRDCPSSLRHRSAEKHSEYSDKVINYTHQVTKRRDDFINSTLLYPRNFSSDRYFFPDHCMSLFGYSAAPESGTGKVAYVGPNKEPFYGFGSSGTNKCLRASLFIKVTNEWVTSLIEEEENSSQGV